MNKVIVFGDSIAYGKWDIEGGWVQRLRRFLDEKYNIGKDGNVLAYNLSIPGEVAIRMVDRVQAELEIRLTDPKDEVIVIFAIGVNDSCPNNWMRGKQTPPDEFKKAISTMISLAVQSNCQVMVLGLAPVNFEKSTGLPFSNEIVKQYDQYLGEICDELKVKKIDVFEYLLKSGYANFLVDTFHPDSRGHAMIFEKVIEKMKFL